MTTDHISPSISLHPTHAPATASVPAAEASVPAARKKGKKARSAWIAFASRVTAQLVGAAATVFLGLAVVNSHGPRATAETPSVAPATAPVTLAKAHRGAGPALVVLPFADYTPAVTVSPMADGVTEAITTALAQSGRVHVTSRTSAMRYKKADRPVPAIAAELGVDLVVEGSIVRQADRVRVTVQLIDAASDAHLWARTYDRPARDVLTLDAEIGATVDRDLAGVLPRSLQAPSASASSADAATLQRTRTLF